MLCSHPAILFTNSGGEVNDTATMQIGGVYNPTTTTVDATISFTYFVKLETSAAGETTLTAYAKLTYSGETVPTQTLTETASFDVDDGTPLIEEVSHPN